MPQEITARSAVLNAVSGIGAIADIAAAHEGHYNYEIDLEVTVYGRNYNGRKVGPYVRLLQYQPGEEIIRQGEWGGNTFYFVAEGKADVYLSRDGSESKIAEISAGTQFGEMSVLAGVPRAATVRAPQNEPVNILEVQRPALRLFRKLPKFGEVLDITYRRNGRANTLQRLAAATKLSPDVIKQLEPVSVFRIFTKNHTLFHEGDAINRLYILKTGWVRLTSKNVTPISTSDQDWNIAARENFVGPGHCFGAEAITRDSRWNYNGTLMGRTEVLEISISKLRQLPELREVLMRGLGQVAVPPDALSQPQPLPIVAAQESVIEAGLVDGTNLLVMDMDLCVRCGNCSMACHQMHGHSRLLRRGIHVTRPVSLKKNSGFQSLLSPSVCMHCQDPECLTGCPTGAIGRFGAGQVDINPKTCIGCGDCATQCPYNSISMIPRRPKVEEKPASALQRLLRLESEPLPPAVEQTEDLVATKCNLCSNTPLNPDGVQKRAYSCEENCPTGALLRVNPREYFAEIKQIEMLTFRDATQAIGRGLHTSHKDRGKQITHLLGILGTIALSVLTVMLMWRTGRREPLVGSWLNFYWLTGFVGLAGIAVVMAYPFRRQMYKRRAGPLRYWMLIHSYAGIIAGLVLLFHGGTHSGGALTTALMISFDLVILTGLFGILCYVIAPRMLTKIEGQPLLIEDLTQRREELSEEIGSAMASVSPQTKSAIQSRVLPKFLSLGYLLRQYLKKENLETMLDAARREAQSDAASLPANERDHFMHAVESAAMLRRVDALIYLHQLLKLWLAPHVLVTSLMLALLIAHIVQVVWFAGW
jgi:Fe-S-cluster-containing dehydrogenase component/CRP-like cAMP-binding protein